MRITLKDEKKAVEFMGIERNELDILVEYFRSKDVKVVMEEDVKKNKPDIPDEDDDEEEDGDFEAEGVDSDDDDDDSFEQESLSGSDKKKDKKHKKDDK